MASAPRFYCDVPLDSGDVGREIELPPSAATHASRALRLRAGDDIVVFTGRGGEFSARLTRIDKRAARARIDAFEGVEREGVHAVTLVQSLIAADMMDLVVRKAVELGAASIVPVFAERSQRMPAERAAKRVAHWRQIAVAACEQCGRNRIPPVATIEPLAAWLDARTQADGIAVMLSSAVSVSLASLVQRGVPPRALVVGPEGGFSDVELAHATRRGLVQACLSPRTLRAETAALSALSTVEALAS